MKAFAVTYEIVTPESAEHGDAEERGYVLPGGWQYTLDDLGDESPLMTLREAVELIGLGVYTYGDWFTTADPDIDYTTGGEETRSLHPPRNITPSSFKRLCKLLGAHTF